MESSELDKVLEKTEQLTQGATSIKSATKLILIEFGQDELAERLMKDDHTVLPAIRALSGNSELEMIGIDHLKEEMGLDIQSDSDVERLVNIIKKDVSEKDHPFLDKLLKYAAHTPKPEDEDSGFDPSIMFESLNFCLAYPLHGDVIHDIVAFFLESLDIDEEHTNGLGQAVEKMQKAMNQFQSTMTDVPTDDDDIPTDEEECDDIVDFMVKLSTTEGKQEVLDDLTAIANEIEAVDVEANLEASDDDEPIHDMASVQNTLAQEVKSDEHIPALLDTDDELDPIIEQKLLALPSIQERLSK